MATRYDVSPKRHIAKIAEELKKMDAITAPEWAKFAKTGAQARRAPVQRDWWHTRTASVLRTVDKLGPIGVSKLRIRYGGRRRRGHQPPEFRKSSGNVLRKILQQLEKVELIKHVEKGVHKGRVLTPKGKALIDKCANEIAKTMPKHKITKISEASAKDSTEGVIEQIKEKTPSAEELVKKTKEKFEHGHVKKEPTAEELIKEAE